MPCPHVYVSVMLLPLFPLDVVLFPGTRVPLHIFEDRYRALLADVLAGDGVFGIVAGHDREPEPGALGVVAHVLTHQPLEDGRANILVEGVGRFVVRSLAFTERPYLVANVAAFDDEADAPELNPESLRTLRELGNRCRRAMATLADLPEEGGWSRDGAEITFQVAGQVPWEAAQAAPLLALRTPRARAELLLRILPGIVPDLERRAEVHRRARTNGKGAHGVPTAG
jgi:Lon protease-like protein